MAILHPFRAKHLKHLYLPTVPPNKVVLDGPSTVGTSSGDAVVRCESAHANPAPKLTLTILDSEGKDVADDLHSSGDVIIRLQETK